MRNKQKSVDVGVVPCLDAPQLLALSAVICEHPSVICGAWEKKDVLQAVSLLHGAIGRATDGASVMQLIRAVDRMSDLYCGIAEPNC